MKSFKIQKKKLLEIIAREYEDLKDLLQALWKDTNLMHDTRSEARSLLHNVITFKSVSIFN